MREQIGALAYPRNVDNFSPLEYVFQSLGLPYILTGGQLPTVYAPRSSCYVGYVAFTD